MFETEYKELRNELRDLKLCQRQYFFVAIGGTGALLGLSRFAEPEAIGFILLAPLVLLLPCWVMFFDKAASITRMTGYLRYVEEAIAGAHGPDPQFYGFETAVAKFRQTEQGIERPPNTVDFPIPWHTRHRYWKANWYTYWLLSLLCVAASVYWELTAGDRSLGWIIVGAISVCAFGYLWYLSLLMLTQLTSGRYSYENVARFWQEEVFPALV